MANTTTKVGRLGLAHPDFGYDAGTGQFYALRAMYTKIGDHTNSRFFKQAALADGASVDFEHGLLCAFGELKPLLYTYDGNGVLTRVNPTTGYTIAASPSNPPTTEPTTHVRVTNNTGSAKDIALVLVQGRGSEKLDDLDDVDLTTPPEDGQALVWDAIAAQFKPGASGDSSFKLQSVTDPNAVIKGGFMLLPDGRELATYDGAGSLSTDFGKDLTVSLNAILPGGDPEPADSTTYYLYIDLASLGAAITCTDNGRKLYAVQEANLYLTTTTPDAINRARYVARGFVHSADTGNAWSGTGAKFGTMAFLKAEQPPVAASPLMYSLSQQLVSDVGTAGQIRQGHQLSTKSWPVAALDTAKLSFWGLAGSLADGYGSRAFNGGGSPGYANGILGDANGAVALVAASSQYLYNASPVFNPGNQNFTVGGWFYSADWIPASLQMLFAQGAASTSNMSFGLGIHSSGIKLYASTSGTAWALDQVVPHSLADATPGWHHVALRYTATGNVFTVFVDGKAIGQYSLGGNLIAASAPALHIGAIYGTTFFDGRADEVFFASNLALTDMDIAKLASTYVGHNKALPAGRQVWAINHYAAGLSPVSVMRDAIIDQGDANGLFVDLSGCDPTDKVDLQLYDGGAAGAVSVPTQSCEFTFTATGQLTTSTTAYPTNLAEDVRALQAWQKTTLGWELVDLVGMISVTATAPRYLQGNIDALVPSPTNPVRIIVASTAGALAVMQQTAGNLVGLVDGSRPGGGVYLKRPDGTVRELALDNNDNIVVLDT